MKIKKPKAGIAKREITASSSASPPKAGGVAKKKHIHGKRQHALLPQLSAAAPEQKRVESAKEKKARKRSAKSAVLGAVDGMRSSLDELLAASEKKFKQQAEDADMGPASSHAITSKKRQKMVADETAQMQQVIQHPAFIADPFGALQQHLANTVGAGGGKRGHKSRS